MLYSRGQLEASRAEVVRSERRGGRGPLPTLQSINVDEVKLYVAKELAIAGKPTSEEAPPDETSGAETAEDGDDDGDDIHSRPTVSRIEPVEPASDRSDAPARDQLPTVRIDTREVRARLVTVPDISVAAAEPDDIDPSNRETLPPPAVDPQKTDHPKRTIGSRLLELFGGKPKGKQEE